VVELPARSFNLACPGVAPPLLWREITRLEDAHHHHFDEDDHVTFRFNEPAVALSYLRDAGLFETGCV